MDRVNAYKGDKQHETRTNNRKKARKHEQEMASRQSGIERKSTALTGDLMKEMPLTRAISTNVGRAAQHELDGDSKAEIEHLLFAVRDITETLKVYRVDRMSISPTEWMDLHVAKRYSNMLSRVSSRICELIEDGV